MTWSVFGKPTVAVAASASPVVSRVEGLQAKSPEASH